MPALSQDAKTSALEAAITESGATGFARSARNPREVVITSPIDMSVWCYVWTLTFGGRRALPDEFRIQMTTVASPLPLNPAGPTVILGIDPDTGVFVGFDLGAHTRFTQGSPSVQVPRTLLDQALANGMAFFRKSNDETVVAFRPDQFLDYARSAPRLHAAMERVEALPALQYAAETGTVPEESPGILDDERRTVEYVARVSRAASFRRQVLAAYEGRCAITRMQLRLVEAAHIIPVAGATSGPDDVRNGVALSPTYHKAYDSGLIYLDTDYYFKVNEEKVAHLRKDGLDRGLSDLTKRLGKMHLPADKRQWPPTEIIRKAMAARGVP